ncbi:unnamed protein product, partial [Echinostoma caproni]|uniref:Ribonuclease E/G n=1 Tax=Echinostoma caproni TaxID=27848 RepID=A0A183A3T9_9TREM
NRPISNQSPTVELEKVSDPGDPTPNTVFTADSTVPENDQPPKPSSDGATSPDTGTPVSHPDHIPENIETERSTSEPLVLEPPVLNISYGLSNRLQFPAPPVRPVINNSSRRLRFRLDTLLARRVAAAEADKAAAKSAEANIETLEEDIRELEQERTKLTNRLTELAEQAQEARTAKAKAVKARQAAGPVPALRPPIRSAPFIVSAAGNRSVNLAAAIAQ